MLTESFIEARIIPTSHGDVYHQISSRCHIVPKGVWTIGRNDD